MVALALAMISLAAPARAQDSAVVRPLIEREHAMMRAVQERDSATLDLVIGDEFTLTSSESSGQMLRKPGYITGSLDSSVLAVDSFRFHDFDIDLYGEVAVVRSRLDWESTYRGQRWSSDFLKTDVWIRRDGRWQIVTRHSSHPRSQIAVHARGAAEDSTPFVAASTGAPMSSRAFREIFRAGLLRAGEYARA